MITEGRKTACPELTLSVAVVLTPCASIATPMVACTRGMSMLRWAHGSLAEPFFFYLFALQQPCGLDRVTGGGHPYDVSVTGCHRPVTLPPDLARITVKKG